MTFPFPRARTSRSISTASDTSIRSPGPSWPPTSSSATTPWRRSSTPTSTRTSGRTTTEKSASLTKKPEFDLISALSSKPHVHSSRHYLTMRILWGEKCVERELDWGWKYFEDGVWPWGCEYIAAFLSQLSVICRDDIFTSFRRLSWVFCLHFYSKNVNRKLTTIDETNWSYRLWLSDKETRLIKDTTYRITVSIGNSNRPLDSLTSY